MKHETTCSCAHTPISPVGLGTGTGPSVGKAAVPHPELSSGRRWGILMCFVFGAALSVMSQTTMTASMAAVIAEFGVDATQGQWLTTAYMLTLGVVAVMVTFGVMISTETFMCLYIQDDQGLSPTLAGMSLLPGTVVAACVSPFTGRVLDRRGPLSLTVVGFALMGVVGATCGELAGIKAALAVGAALTAAVGVATIACMLRGCGRTSAA